MGSFLKTLQRVTDNPELKTFVLRLAYWYKEEEYSETLGSAVLKNIAVTNRQRVHSAGCALYQLTGSREFFYRNLARLIAFESTIEDWEFYPELRWARKEERKIYATL